MIHMLPEIKNNLNGYNALVELYDKHKDVIFEDIEIDMSRVSFFEADMCAVFGAILYRLGKELNDISLTNIRDDVKKILSKNGFLSHYGSEKIPDTYKTTIPYKRFDVKDGRYFSAYIEKEFIKRTELPSMTSGLQKKIRESIFEVFNNAVVHSQSTDGIFSCGQYYPAKDKIRFVLADLGIGIQKNIKDKLGLNLSPIEAIKWALDKSNTTKNGKIPGGLGLKILIEFIELNSGYIQIVSDAGYWERNKLRTTEIQLNYPFPGTVVSININTADTHKYALFSDITEDDIF